MNYKNVFHTDVLIIGAGIAGLTAAELLRRAGIPCIILEKGDSSGGRLKSSQQNSKTQLGAEFIHGRSGGFTKLLQMAGLRVREYLMDGGDGRCFRAGGKVFWQDSQFAHDVETQYEELHCYEGAKDMSVEQFAERLGIKKEGAGHFARARVVRIEAAALSDISALALTAGMKNVGDSDRNSRIEGGFGALVKWLSESAPIVYRTRVTGVNWRKRDVAVFTDRAATFVAKRIIITVPLDVARDLTQQFSPKLPSEIQRAINGLQMGSAVKVLVHVGAIRWKNFSAYATESPIQVWWNHSDTQGCALVGFTAGPGTTECEKLTEGDIAKQAVEDIGAIDGTLKLEDILSVEKVCWNRVGSMAYSHVPVGFADARKALMASVDQKLWFCGEASSKHGLAGTVSGAVESATKAAEEIASLCQRDAC